MMIEPSRVPSSRREFLRGIFPAGVLLCSGCGLLSASSRLKAGPQDKADQHKFLENPGLTMRDVFRFAYQCTYIPVMQALADKVGREKLVELVKEATNNYWAQWTRRIAQRLPEKNLAAFFKMDALEGIVGNTKQKERFWSLANTSQTIEGTEKSHEIKVTECLWAETFREASAGDIGFASICYADEVMAAAFDERLKLIREKTLMRGDDCCHFRWVWEG